MAIAALVIHANPDDLPGLMPALQASGLLTQFQQAAGDRIGAILECPSDRLLRTLEELQAIPGVWNLELAYVNYEDDLNGDGQMPCPPIEDLFPDRRGSK